MRRGSHLLRRIGRSSGYVSEAVHTQRWFRASAAAASAQQGCYTKADSQSWIWLGTATAAAAACIAWPAAAFCEPNEQGGWAAVSRTVERIWRNLDEDLHRNDALRYTPFADRSRPEAPTLGFNSGWFSLTFPVRPGVEVSSVMAEIAKQFGASDKAQPAFTVEDRRPNTVYTLNSATPTASTASHDAKQLVAQVHVPQTSLISLPHVELQKRGAFTSQELDGFAAVLRVANVLPSGSQVQSYSFSTHSDNDLPPEFDPSSFLRHLQHAAMSSVFGELDFSEIDAHMRKLFQIAVENNQADEEAQVRSTSSRMPPSNAHHRQVNTNSAQPPEEEKKSEYGSREADQAAKQLQDLGAMVYPPGNKDTIDWGMLAGYSSQKQQIEDTMLLPLKHKEVYEEIARGTRHTYASNRPRAVLFEGPPGTGKTSSARVIAAQASVPLVYVPLEAVGSKWYGESERKLSDMFKAAEALPGCIIFLDEVDSLATSRGSEMHEATRRLLGVLLRHLDGFETDKRSIVIAATNRKEDLDPALRSRFNTSVEFGLPDEACRAEILRLYAKHLSPEDVASIAAATAGLAGRDLKDLSEQAERRWASKIIRKLVSDQLPSVAEYMAAASQRLKEIEAAQKPSRLPFLF